MDFNGKLFHRLVDYAIVYSDGRVVFTFRNGVDSRDGNLKSEVVGNIGLCQMFLATYLCAEKDAERSGNL